MSLSTPDQPLIVQDFGTARELIHGATEFLFRYGERPTGFDFDRAFGATDTLLDIEEALFAFKHKEWPTDLGTAYLLTFGTLQALVAQQDATRQLCDAFGIRFQPNKHPELLNIRDIRVRASGHPSRHGRNARPPRADEEQGSTFLVRQLFTRETAKIVTYFDGPSGRESKDVNLFSLYTTQQRSLCRALRLVWTKILIEYPEAAMFRWDPWQAQARYPGDGISIVLS